MDTFKIISISLALISPSLCQYEREDQGQYYDRYSKQPPPQIISHKQALNHDGNFKYLFTSDNGLAQGETIAPDGSRNGGYSYVDPTGRKISVKYTAGKEGFKILEADHLPKAPLPIAPVPGVQPRPGYAAPHRGEDDGQYRSEYKPREYAAPQNYIPAQQYAQPRSYTPPAQISNAIENKEPEYNDEPGKPYSFGTGYVFEFGG